MLRLLSTSTASCSTPLCSFALERISSPFFNYLSIFCGTLSRKQILRRSLVFCHFCALNLFSDSVCFCSMHLHWFLFLFYLTPIHPRCTKIKSTVWLMLLFISVLGSKIKLQCVESFRNRRCELKNKCAALVHILGAFCSFSIKKS